MLESELNRAAAILQSGGLVAFPTETVYGLGANALDATAVARIFEAKGRPRFDPLIVHAANTEQALTLCVEVPEVARKLAKAFWPGPLTLVLKKAGVVPEIVTAGLETVAVRVPDHPLALALIGAAGTPIAAPSANRFGRISPTTAEHVREDLGHAVDMVIDGGPCAAGVESTVVSLVDGPTLLRPGALGVESIEPITGKLARGPHEARRPASPGMLSQHYAPRTPLAIGSAEDIEVGDRRVGLLSFKGVGAGGKGLASVEVLSAKGDLREAATNLFAALRRLDGQGLDLIVAETVPEQGLGLAINDRLRRAVHE